MTAILDFQSEQFLVKCQYTSRPRWLMQRFSPKASSVLEKKIFKGFYHIWAWRPSWSTSRDHFSNLSFPQPKDPYLKCPQQVWHMLRTYADFRVNHCGSWHMSADVRYKSADVRASVKDYGLLRTFFRISWGYLFADVRSSMQVSLRTSAKACVKF